VERPRSDRSVAVDAYVFDILMHDLVGHDRAASAFIVFLYLWRHSLALGEAAVTVSLREIADGTGLSKRGVQDAITVIVRRKLVRIARRGITDVPTYTVQRPWRRGSSAS
jgi:hypothetical protein